MHTVTMTLVGLAVLLVCVLAARAIEKRWSRHAIDGAAIFIVVWLIVSIRSFYVGTAVMGVPATTEIAVHLVIFGLPAALAWYLSRRRKLQRSFQRAVHNEH